MILDESVFEEWDWEDDDDLESGCFLECKKSLKSTISTNVDKYISYKFEVGEKYKIGECDDKFVYMTTEVKRFPHIPNSNTVCGRRFSRNGHTTMLNELSDYFII